ncbi:MAG: hypothetical protein AB7O66_14625 [Limisphaerales bacterium]
MRTGDVDSLPFPGFPDFRANVTLVPIQFFTVVVPTSSRGVTRIVGYALRQVLGWVDQDGNPKQTQLQLSYRELIENAGVSRDSIAEALHEAVERRFLTCLERPASDSAGRPGRSGVYTLRWDKTGPLTHSPDTFQGFFYPAGAVVEETVEGRTVCRSKVARKFIPNAFFDHLLPRERLSVIRVVGALLFYSIQWGPGGERKVPVNKSITELSRLAHLTRQKTHAAVAEARARGYIEQIDPGRFGPTSGTRNPSACYRIRWSQEDRREATPPRVGAGQQGFPDRSEKVNREAVGKGVREFEDRSEKGNGGPVGKREQTRSEKGNREESEKVNSIRIKEEYKTEAAAAARADALPGGPTAESSESSESVEAAYEALKGVGFDAVAARRLAAEYPMEVIQRQIEWIPLRRSNRSRLGLLRCAITEDWPKPETGQGPGGDADRLARLFASHYYAAYHGFTGEPATDVFDKDIEIALPFLRRVFALQPDEGKVPEWGRRFGAMMRTRHQGDPKALPNLSNTLRLFGDQLLATLKREGTQTRDAGISGSRVRHQEAFAEAYRGYLRSEEERLRRTLPVEYEGFVAWRAKRRDSMTQGRIVAPASWLARFDSEEARLGALAEFFEGSATFPVLDFWTWDQRLNPQGFQAAISGEVHA